MCFGAPALANECTQWLLPVLPLNAYADFAQKGITLQGKMHDRSVNPCVPLTGRPSFMLMCPLAAQLKEHTVAIIIGFFSRLFDLF